MTLVHICTSDIVSVNWMFPLGGDIWWYFMHYVLKDQLWILWIRAHWDSVRFCWHQWVLYMNVVCGKQMFFPLVFHTFLWYNRLQYTHDILDYATLWCICYYMFLWYHQTYILAWYIIPKMSNLCLLPTVSVFTHKLKFKLQQWHYQLVYC